MFIPRKLFFVFLSLILFSLKLYSQEINSGKIIIVTEINIEGNHITKEKIVSRELLFKVGDEIVFDELLSLISRSKDNLLNTSLFNFVDIYYVQDQGNVKIEIKLQERWYIWPYPVLEHADRNFSSFLKNQEWSRVDYGLYVLINNFRGRKEILKLKSIFGYNNRYVLFYNKPYIDKKQKIGFGIDVDYFQNHEVAFNIVNDELIYLKLNNEYGRKTLKISNFYTYRPYMYTNHLLNIKYTNVAINDSVFLLNNGYFFDNKKELNFLTIAYNFDYDKRDSKIYPLEGFRFFFLATKNGLGILSNKGNLELSSIIEKNYRLNKKLFMNTSLLGQINYKHSNSFYFSEAIGYKNYLRGMEYYVSNGNSYYISKTNLKYELIPQTKLNLKFLPTDKFSKAHYALYLNLFFDSGYVDSDYNINNKTTNDFLYSGGMGLDIVTYYDKVLRIEYSLNKFGEHGIFFHLGAPIIED